jgi:hypothetical protein
LDFSCFDPEKNKIIDMQELHNTGAHESFLKGIILNVLCRKFIGSKMKKSTFICRKSILRTLILDLHKIDNLLMDGVFTTPYQFIITFFITSA